LFSTFKVNGYGDITGVEAVELLRTGGQAYGIAIQGGVTPYIKLCCIGPYTGT